MTWSKEINYCKDFDTTLLVGDFNGDKKLDLCHYKNGSNDYAYANQDGHFTGMFIPE